MKKLTLREAIKIIDQSSEKIGNTEEWINDFMNGLADNMDDISTIVFCIVEALEIINGTKKDDGYFKAEHPLFLEFLKEKKGGYAKDIETMKKVNSFFQEWDI